MSDETKSVLLLRGEPVLVGSAVTPELLESIRWLHDEWQRLFDRVMELELQSIRNAAWNSRAIR